jgi:membrane-bound lytic murein transglycosylase B
LPLIRRLIPSFVRPALLAFLACAGVACVGLALSQPAKAASGSFDAWLASFRQQALAAGVRPQTFDAAFAGVQPIQRVIELDHKQPEVTFTFDQYISRVVSPARVTAGRNALAANRVLLDEIGRRYGVQPQYIVALWGVETNYGQQIGNYSIIGALATLAYDGRRGAFFSKELIAALRILDQGRIQPSELRGSWAGAMGQTQFMPSSYLRFAVDYNGDGKADIWRDKPDIFASIANYLASSGWNGHVPWGQQVILPPNFNTSLIANLKNNGSKPLDSWRILGVASSDGHALLPNAAEGSLVQPGGPTGPTLLVTSNYRTILKWNRSLYFATAVSYLADRIAN